MAYGEAFYIQIQMRASYQDMLSMPRQVCLAETLVERSGILYVT